MIKLKNILLEKKELDQSYITKAAAMTDRNYHNEARWTLARGLKNKKLEQAYSKLFNSEKMPDLPSDHFF